MVKDPSMAFSVIPGVISSADPEPAFASGVGRGPASGIAAHPVRPRQTANAARDDLSCIVATLSPSAGSARRSPGFNDGGDRFRSVEAMRELHKRNAAENVLSVQNIRIS